MLITYLIAHKLVGVKKFGGEKYSPITNLCPSYLGLCLNMGDVMLQLCNGLVTNW